MSYHSKSSAKKRQRRVLFQSAIEACEQRMLLSGVQVASIDGTGNNVDNPDWGSSHEQLVRNTTVEYGDGVSSLAGQTRASAREVSNAVASQTELTENSRLLTDYIWIWGQFLDHDIDLTEGADPAEAADIDVPTGDPFFDPFNTGLQTIGLNRSNYDETTGTDISNPRQQINEITAFLDGSVIYGSDDVRAAALRTFVDGKLKTSEGDLLPFNTDGLPNAGGTSETLFLAGDVRANENILLSSMHTIWVREHNRIAEEIKNQNSTLSDEQIYQEARSIVRAELQAITYNEFLPALLGNEAIGAYSGYDPTVNPGIANVFSTAAYRLGHSLLSPELLRLNPDGSTAAEGNIALRNAFFNPSELVSTGIDSLLQGGAAQVAQELDNQVVDDVRNFLFGPPGSGGFDLASLNIQRGRDHGLADYNQTRIDYGLSPVTSFSEISSNPNVVANLESVYSSVDEIDVWVGLLAEDHVAGSSTGELMQAILVDQFTRLRDGDRFWYENIMNRDQIRRINRTTLADVIERNSNVSNLQHNVFFDSSVLFHKVPEHVNNPKLEVRVRGNNIEIFDKGARRIVAAGRIGEIDQVMIYGAQGQSDRIYIDSSLTPEALPGGIVVSAGVGQDDMLFILGSNQQDIIDVNAGQTDLNGQKVSHTGFEVQSVSGRDGDDWIMARGRQMLEHLGINGGRGRDIIVGSAGDDLILGHDGNDIIKSGNGNDRVEGGAGHDQIFAGRGDDFVLGGSGNDSIYGSFGSDGLHGNTGHDRIYGGDGDDGLFGEYGRDWLFGENGNDFLDGGRDRDHLDGGAGHNVLRDSDFMPPPPPSSQDSQTSGTLMDSLAGRVGGDSDSGSTTGSSEGEIKDPTDCPPPPSEPATEFEELGLAALNDMFNNQG